MNKNTLTWIAVLIAAAVALVAWPQIRSQLNTSRGGGSGFAIAGPNVDTSIEQIVLANPVPVGPTEIVLNEITALIALTVLVGALVVPTGIVLFLIFRGLDGTVQTVKTDDEFQTKVTGLNTKYKAIGKEYLKSQPPGGVPSHNRPGWSAISASLLFGLLMAFLGAAYSANFLEEANMQWYAAGFAAVGILTSYFALTPQSILKSDSEEGLPVSGETIYLILTGVIVIGLGIGVMMWVRTTGLA